MTPLMYACMANRPQNVARPGLKRFPNLVIGGSGIVVLYRFVPKICLVGRLCLIDSFCIQKLLRYDLN